MQINNKFQKFGNYLRRVAVENVRPDNHGEEIIEEGYVEPDKDIDRFAEVETPVKEMETDLEMAEIVRKLQEEVKELTVEKDMLLEKQKKEIDDKDLQVSVRNESDTNKQDVIENRKHKRKLQKERKQLEHNKYPKLAQEISFREKGSQNWKLGRVVRTFKKTSKHNMLALVY